jgi:multimeric flavodoxin WrbA
MKKKVLILSSTPRRGGNSDLLCDMFLKGALEAGHESEKIFLGDKALNYCRGCRVCYIRKRACPQKDDAAEIIDKMVNADVIVLASPVYIYSICAQLKTLLDRVVSRYNEIKNKELY